MPKADKIEHEVGEVFEFKGNKLITTEVENSSCCHKCFFLYVSHECGKHICLGCERKDGKDVMFQYVE